ncbi:MAG TPA: OB-fold domain-containing protein [Acidimicrobiales bacterium]
MFDGKPFRVLPRITDDTEFFWTAGRDGVLRFLACDSCRYIVHPPAPICPRDHSRHLSPCEVSGRGTVHTFTVNHQQWYPDLDPPYVIAIVTIEEQDDVRLMTNLVHVAPDAVTFGMPVRVVFDRYLDVWLPMFEPDPTRGGPEPDPTIAPASPTGGGGEDQ